MELLSQAFATQLINLEEAEIYEVNSKSMTDWELSSFLQTQNLYSDWRFTERAF